MNKEKFATLNPSGTEFSKGYTLNQLNRSLPGPNNFRNSDTDQWPYVRLSDINSIPSETKWGVD